MYKNNRTPKLSQMGTNRKVQVKLYFVCKGCCKQTPEKGGTAHFRLWSQYLEPFYQIFDFLYNKSKITLNQRRARLA